MRSPGRAGTARASRWTAVAAVALAIVAALWPGGGAAVAQEPAGSGAGEVRVAARALADGRVEVALQTRTPGGGWGGRVAPPRRFLPAAAAPGRWLWTGPVTLEGAEWRITARRLADGRAEVALQARHSPGDAWSGRRLPERRFLPASVEPGRWLTSSPVTTAFDQPQIVSFYGHPDLPYGRPRRRGEGSAHRHGHRELLCAEGSTGTLDFLAARSLRRPRSAAGHLRLAALDRADAT